MKKTVQPQTQLQSQAQKEFYKKLILSTNLLVFIYGLIYFYLGAKASAIVGDGSLLFFTPFVLFFESKGYATLSRILFIFACSICIYATPMGVPLHTDYEHYFISGALVALFVFEPTQKKELFIGMSIPFVFWLLAEFEIFPPIPAELKPQNFPVDFFKHFNFIGAYVLIALTVKLYNTFIVREKIEQLKDLKEKNNQIRKRESFLENVLGTLPSLVSYVDKNAVYQYMSPGYKKWFGINPAAYIGKATVEVVGEEATAKLRPYFDRTLKGETVDFEQYVKLKNAGERTIHCIYIPDKNFEGECVGIIIIATDITETRKAQRELENTTKELTNFFRVSVDPLCIVRPNGNFAMVSPALPRLLGYSPEEMDAKNHIDFIEPEDLPKTKVAVKKAMQGYPIENFENRYVCKDGSHRSFSWAAAFDFDSGLLYLSARDVTELEKAKERVKLEKAKSLQSAKLASLGELSAGIAHEINNPLTIIAGNISIIEISLNDSEKIVKTLRNMEKACERISRISKGLRKYSRSQSKEAHKLYFISEIVKEAVELSHMKAKRHYCEIRTSIPNNVKILCDEVEIGQVLINLINNAIDAVKDLDEKWVEISGFEKDGLFYLQVRDSGNGIPEKVAQNLFQPFYTTKPVGEGTGLGLSIIQGILADHGATIELLKTDPHTCFELHFINWPPNVVMA